jgi:tetratricopeptide (TPR) repeat protein
MDRSNFSNAGTWVLILFIGCLFACADGDKKSAKILSNEEFYLSDSAISQLTKALDSRPKDADLWYQRAKAFYRLDAFDEAIGDMSAAMSLDTANVEYHLFLSDVYVEYFKSRLALNTLLRASVLFPENEEVLEKLSELQLTLKLYSESMATLDQWLRLDPQNGKAFYLIGNNYKERGDTALAVGAFQKAVNFDPDLRDAWINMAILRGARKERQVERYFDAAILADKGGYVARMAKAEYLWGEGRLEDAKTLYLAILQDFPENIDNTYNYGLILLEQDSLEKAKTYFNKTLNIKPNFYKALYYRGVIYQKEGKKDSARVDFERCLEMMPSFEKPKIALETL